MAADFGRVPPPASAVSADGATLNFPWGTDPSAKQTPVGHILV